MRALKRLVSWLWTEARQPGWGRIVAPLVVVVVLAPWLVLCISNYVHGLLNRDSMMFLYAAWSVMHGSRLYETITVPDGPFAVVLHMLFLLGSGTDEHKFRVLDLLLHVLGSAGIGALLVPPNVQRPVATRVVWAFVFTALWLATLFRWGVADTSQREQYYTLLGLSLEPDSGDVRRWQRVKWMGVGIGVAAFTMMLFVAIWGSLEGYAYWNFKYVAIYYPYFLRMPIREVVASLPKEFAAPAVGCIVVGVFGGARGVLTPTAVALSAASFAGLLVATLQSKGWPSYHIPTVGFAHTFVVYLLMRAWFATPDASGVGRGILVMGLGALVITDSVNAVQSGPWLRKDARGESDQSLLDVRRAGAWIHDQTQMQDRLFYYGHDSAIPFVAQRLPASPIFVRWLACVTPRDTTPAAEERINAMHREIGDKMCNRFRGQHPRVIAVSDGWCVSNDCIKELGEMCPDIPLAVETEYQPARAFGGNRVFLRKP
jgi:hypothetical protein